MPNKEAFIEAINKSYTTDKAHIHLGSAVLDGEVVSEAKVNLPLRMMNRHGLIAGATGSGKTRTLQLLAEQLSDAGVPVFLTDVKGDISGLGNPGIADARLQERAKLLGLDFQPTGFPLEFYSLSGNKGSQMRATILEFGPILLSKVLELNDTQTGVLAVLFKYADDKKLPMVDLSDLKKVLNYLAEGAGAAEIKGDYGSISTSTSGTILRKIVALEQQGVDKIFGEKSFDIEDLFEKVDGKGVISLLNLSDMQSQPAMFSTFLLSLLAELYARMPEAGDLDKPKMVFFFDEAHLLFKDAPKAFLEQIEQIIRLIRSKGIGVFFCTQMPSDVPASVLGQLGNRVQHVLRAFTPQDAEGLKQTVKTYPKSSFYEIDRALTSMGIGQALITVLNEKGIPTEVAVTHLCPPRAVMGPMPESQYNELLSQSDFYKKYKETLDPESAFEILSKKMQVAEEEKQAVEQAKVEEKEERAANGGRKEKSTIEQVLANPVAREVGKQLVRGIFGMLFGTAAKTTKRKSSIF